jgi:beta-mannanase
MSVSDSRAKNSKSAEIKSKANQLANKAKTEAIKKGTDVVKNATSNVTAKVTSTINNVKGKVDDAKNKLNDAKDKINKAKGLLNGGLGGVISGALGVLASNVMGKLIGKLQKVPALGVLTKVAATAALMTGIANAIKTGSSALALVSKQSKSGSVENDASIKAIDPNYKGKTGNANATSATYKEYDSTTAEEKAKNAATVAEYSEKMLKKMPLQSKVESEAVKEYSNKMIAKMNKTITDNMNKANIKPTKL